MSHISAHPARHTDPVRGRGWITIISEKPTDDTELDTALAICVAQEGKKVYDLLSEFTSAKKRITADLLPRLLERLAQAGAITPERSKVLGLFERTTWPAVDPALEDGVRSRLQSALVAGLTPTERTIALIASLNSCSLLTKVVPTEDKKLVRRRAKELSEGNWAAQAVVDAITEVSSTTGSMVVMAAAAT